MRYHKDCPWGTSVKFWMLRHSFMILVGLVLAALAVFWGLIYCYGNVGGLPWSELLAAYAGFAALGYFLVSHHNSGANLLVGLMGHFNKRYANLASEDKGEGKGGIDLKNPKVFGAVSRLMR